MFIWYLPNMKKNLQHKASAICITVFGCECWKRCLVNWGSRKLDIKIFLFAKNVGINCKNVSDSIVTEISETDKDIDDEIDNTLEDVD